MSSGDVNKAVTKAASNNDTTAGNLKITIQKSTIAATINRIHKMSLIF